MALTVLGFDQRVLDMEFRMPFHFGNATLTHLPHVILSADVRLEPTGETHTGIAAEGFSPLWFIKDPDVSFAAGLDAMFAVVDRAREIARTIDAESPFAFWLELFAAQRAWAEDTEYPPLLWSFGVSMVERAVTDAYCRATGTTFAAAVRDGSLGIELGEIYGELEGYVPADLLPEEPRREAALRHTVGFTDPLTDDEIEPDERLDDGLPQSLAAYVREQGIASFKIKLSGDADRDAERLADVRDVLEAHCPSEYAFTLDANEQYGDAAEFKRQWKSLRADPELAAFLDRLRYVEQPLARDEALGDDAKRVFDAWADRPPIIIDESDGPVDSFRRALECGYVGTSHKNCKGVFRGVANACLAEHRRRTDPGGEYAVSAEDLTVVGPVGLQQDLAVVATIGAADVERNGHHYFRGMSMVPEAVQDALVANHGDLYRRHDRGFATLAVEDGTLRLDSAVDAPFGYDLDIDLDRFTPRSEWTFDA